MNHFFALLSVESIPSVSFDSVQGYFEKLSQKEIFSIEEEYFSGIVFDHTSKNAPTKAFFQRKDLTLIGSVRLDIFEELSNQFPDEHFQSHEQLVLALFEKSQEKAFDILIGDFSFIIWDSKNQQIFCIKDQIGVRPLFYFQSKEGIILSSTIAAIRAYLGLDHLNINEKYLAKELKNYPVEVGETFFNEIHRLKPAHYFSASAKDLSFTEKRYWHFTEMDTRSFKTPQAVYDELRRLFYQAVESRLKGVSIAATQLSGGMDSSAITVIASRLMPKENLHTFSFVLNEKTRAFSERGVDEQATQNSILEYAQLHQENHHLSDGFYYKDTFECYDKSDQIMGGVANSDAVWQDSMFKQAAEQGVELMFSGFPGDEGISNPGGRYFFEYFHQMDFAWMFKQLTTQPYVFAKQVYRYLSARFSKVTLKGYDEIQKNRNLLSPDSPFYTELKDSSFSFNSSFRQELIDKTFRAHSCLRTESEGLYASQYGIVSAYPMADLRFVQFALSLPMEYFNPKEFSRPLFRKICEGILPDDVRLQKKRNGAMTLAFAEFWKKEQLKDCANWSIRNSLGLFDMNKVFPADAFDLINRKVERYKIDYMVEKNRVNHGK